MCVRVAIIDDHTIMREGLRALLSQEADIKVVGEAADGRRGVQLVEDLRPDVVVMDVGMPDLNGIEATRRIKSRAPSVKVVVLSMHSDKRFVREMLLAGALGYVVKGSPLGELVAAIRAAAANRMYLDAETTDIVAEDYASQLSATHDSGTAMLTSREREVLQLVAEGVHTKDIASRLGVSVKTALAHRRRTMNKLGLDSVADLVKFAVREGLTSLGG
jgi:DNA-binding NarL/FixJ family response regulator